MQTSIHIQFKVEYQPTGMFLGGAGAERDPGAVRRQHHLLQGAGFDPKRSTCCPLCLRVLPPVTQASSHRPKHAVR